MRPSGVRAARTFGPNGGSQGEAAVVTDAPFVGVADEVVRVTGSAQPNAPTPTRTQRGLPRQGLGRLAVMTFATRSISGRVPQRAASVTNPNKPHSSSMSSGSG